MSEERLPKEDLYKQLEALAPDESLDMSAEFLSSVLTHIPAIVSVIAADQRVLFTNYIAPGNTEGDVHGVTVYDLIPDPEEHAAVRATFARVLETGEPDVYVVHAAGEHGTLSRYQNWIGPIRAGDKVVAFTVITRDVSEEWQVQKALKRSEARLRLALETSNMGMWRWDAAQDRTELDEAARAIYELEGPYLEPADLARLVHPDDQKALEEAAARSFLDRTPYSLEHRLVLDGGVRWISGKGTPLYDELGNVEGMLGTIVDVTERRALEDQLRQAQKLEAVGQLTAGIAHNFNNMLASILPALELVRGDVSEENQPLLSSATEAGHRAAQMVRELLTFAGRTRPRARRRHDVASLIAQTIQLCEATFHRAIVLDVEIQEDLPPIAADGTQLEQALLNIFINARDALLSGGSEYPRMEVRVEVTDGDHHEPLETDEAGPWICILISDNGPGMPEAVRARVFEPFFTTKDVGRGTGLGLSTSYAIIREHGGVVTCEPRPGGGTTFAVCLPIDRAAQARKDDVDHAPVAGASVPGRRLLLVDDEEVVRRVLSQMLERAGYIVRTAIHGKDALSKLEEDAAVDVLLLDVNMPGMAFAELLPALTEAAPSAKRVVYTGGAFSDAFDGVHAVVTKPASSERILGVLASVLGAPASPSGARPV